MKRSEQAQPNTSVDRKARSQLEIVLNIWLYDLVSLMIASLSTVLLEACDSILEGALARRLAWCQIGCGMVEKIRK